MPKGEQAKPSLLYLGVTILLIVGVCCYLLLIDFGAGLAPKKLDVLVTFVGITNNASDDPRMLFRISNPYQRPIWYVAPNFGSVKSKSHGYQSAHGWRHPTIGNPFRIVPPNGSEVFSVKPPLEDVNHDQRWRVHVRAGLKQNLLERYSDPVVDRMKKRKRRYGDDLYSVFMKGLEPTPEGALFRVLSKEMRKVSRRR